MEIAQRRGLVVIEDAAQAILARYRGRALGYFGRFAALSFHETKNVHCGEGGALLVNDAPDVNRAEIIHEKGTNRRAFFRGHVDKYTWVDVGSSYLLSDLAAASLWAQLEGAREILELRMGIWCTYAPRSRIWRNRVGYGDRSSPPECEAIAPLYQLLLRPRPSGIAFAATQ